MKKGQNPAAKKTAELALLLAAALILSYIEAVFPLNTGLPFVKIGLSNIAVVTVLYRYNSKTAAVFGNFKCVLALLFTGRLASLFFSLTGMVASLTGMILLKKTEKFSLFGVSVSGAILHIWGQMAAAAIFYQGAAPLKLLPLLTLTAAGSGVLVWLAAKTVIRYAEKTEKLFPDT